MSLRLAHLGTGDFDIPLNPDTPRSRLDDYDIRDDTGKGSRAFSRVLVIPQRIDPTATTLATLEALAIYAGVLTGHGPSRQSLTGMGLPYLLGEDNGGALWNTTGTTNVGRTAQQHVDDWIVSAPNNGITRGDVNASATTFTLKVVQGMTRRQLLAGLCARRTYEWRINPDCTLDIDTAANLFASGQVLLVDEGGPDGAITGLTADLSLDNIDVLGVVSEQYVDWEDNGGTMGSATNTLSADWDAPDGDPIVWRGYDTVGSKGRLRDPERIDQVTAYINQNQTAASNSAATIAARKSTYRLTVTAEVDVHNPLGYLRPGDTAYVYDQRLGIYNTANQLTYRGRAVFPSSLRVVEMDVPIRPEYTVLIVTGGGDIIDVTRDVEPEDRQCVITLGTRRRYTRRPPKPRATNRRKNRQLARLRVYVTRTRR